MGGFFPDRDVVIRLLGLLLIEIEHAWVDQSALFQAALVVNKGDLNYTMDHVLN